MIDPALSVRVPEPEEMDTVEQVEAYASADFSVPHDAFVERLLGTFPALGERGRALDVGCGPADISIRFARAFPGWRIDGLDCGPTMLAYGRAAVEAAGLLGRVSLMLGHVPEAALPDAPYDLIVCNSLLHHLDDPPGFWRMVKRVGAGGRVFLMDLRRPTSVAEAEHLVTLYSSDTPPVLTRDFYNSLLASYRASEVRGQLDESGLGHLQVLDVGDHHLCVFGPLHPLSVD